MEVDNDIEGLARDRGIERFMAEMDMAGVGRREKIKCLKVYLRSRQKQLG